MMTRSPRTQTTEKVTSKAEGTACRSAPRDLDSISSYTKAEIAGHMLNSQMKLLNTDAALEETRGLLKVAQEGRAALEREIGKITTRAYNDAIEARLARNELYNMTERVEAAVSEISRLTQILAESETRAKDLKSALEKSEKVAQDVVGKAEVIKKLEAGMKVLRKQLDKVADPTAAAAKIQDLTAALEKSEKAGKDTAKEADARLKEAEKASAARITSLTTALEKAEKASEGMLKKSEAELEKTRGQVSELQLALREAEAERDRIEPLEKLATERADILERQGLELADLSRMLKDNEEVVHHLKVRFDVELGVARSAVLALIHPPEEERMAPERLGRIATLLVAQGLVDADWYTRTNLDVAESGVDPVMHFLEYGFAEGRLPRPLVAETPTEIAAEEQN